MKSKMTYAVLPFILAALLLFLSCRKEMKQPLSHENEKIAAKGDSDISGHLKQTKTFSSDVLQKWLGVQSALLYSPPKSFAVNAGRFMAYSGVAAYEAVVPGMPSFKSLYGQLNQMPKMPETQPGKAYHWPTCANAALAEITRKLFTFSEATTDASNQLENELNEKYKNEIGNADIFERSKSFGKAVATSIAEWAATDQPWVSNPDFILTDKSAGLWWPEGNTQSTFTIPKPLAYWGQTRPIVAGSTNISSPGPNPYSEVPGSAYYKDMMEVYTVSKQLTFDQKLLALYYNDPAVNGYPSGSHYFPVLKQVFEQLNPSLDVAAHAFAKAGISLMDATIGSFKLKFIYNTERPFQFIRRVIEPSNDPATWWKPLIPTPGYPDFPSNHSMFGASFAYALTSIFGDNVHFTNSTYAGQKITIDGKLTDMGSRNYRSFYDMVQDIAISRLYGGIHTRRACEEGIKQGMKTGEYIDHRVTF
jgi:hypothetical protein